MGFWNICGVSKETTEGIQNYLLKTNIGSLSDRETRHIRARKHNFVFDADAVKGRRQSDREEYLQPRLFPFQGKTRSVNCGIKSYLFFPWQDDKYNKDGAFMILYLERTMSA